MKYLTAFCRTYSLPIGLLLILVFVRVLVPEWITWADPLSFLQYAVFPIVAAFFWIFRIGGSRLPRSVIFFSVLFMLTGAAATFTHLRAHGNTVIVARLTGDTLQSATSVLREHLEKLSPKKTPARFQQDPITPKDAAAVQEMLNAYPGISAVVWGGARWLQVDFRPEPPRMLSSFPDSSHASFIQKRYGIPDLMIVTSVNRLGISFEPVQETSRFISELVAVPNIRSSSIEKHQDAEQRLRSVGLIRAGWTSNAHRAFPQFHLGTLHLLDTLMADRYSPAESRCAVRAFTAGLMQLRPGDNSELRAALLNNLGVAYFVQAVSENKPGNRMTARLFWQRARKVLREKNLMGVTLRAPAIAHYNLRILKNGGAKGKHVKHGGRRRK